MQHFQTHIWLLYLHLEVKFSGFFHSIWISLIFVVTTCVDHRGIPNVIKTHINKLSIT